VRRSRFPPRDREAFMTHWATRVLGDPTVLVQTVTVDGAPAGSIVAWWDQGRRYIGYWLGRPLYADPFIGNTGSVRLLERFGFKPTGTVWYGENEHVLLVLDAT
ncbi:MAG: GNAT family N-acetyltransferase, partial [Actinomycetota bacterium]